VALALVGPRQVNEYKEEDTLIITLSAVFFAKKAIDQVKDTL
jgi:hypothetical protein